MKTEQKKSQNEADKLFAKLERVTLPLDGLEELSALADRINESAQTLVGVLTAEVDALQRAGNAPACIP